MFQFIGYSALSGLDCLNTSPSMVDNIKSTQIQNGIFDHLNISKGAMMTESTTIPTEWNYDTIIDVDFNGNLNGGNVDFLVEQISSIKIKRREKGTFNWITLESIPINTAEDLTFTFIDRLNAYGKDYEYAFVPVLEDIEGNYIINSIFSEFNGVFIGDFDNIYKFLYDVDYCTNARNQQIGTFTPLGRKYPVIVANGLLSYETGSVTASILKLNNPLATRDRPPYADNVPFAYLPSSLSFSFSITQLGAPFSSSQSESGRPLLSLSISAPGWPSG